MGLELRWALHRVLLLMREERWERWEDGGEVRWMRVRARLRGLRAMTDDGCVWLSHRDW